MYWMYLPAMVSSHQEGVSLQAASASEEASLRRNREDEESCVEVEASNSGEVRMRVGKYICPARLVNAFTPMEFEEVCIPCSYSPRNVLGNLVQHAYRCQALSSPWSRSGKFEFECGR